MSIKCPTFGWEMLTQGAESELKSDNDIMICFIHFALVSLGFKAVGTGHSKALYGNEVECETLPRGWSDSYAIRYVMEKQLYLLKGFADNGVVTVTLQKVAENKTSFVSLHSSFVVQRSGKLEEMIPECATLFDMIRTLLVNKLAHKEVNESCMTLLKNQNPGKSTYSAMSIRNQIPAQDLVGWDGNIEEIVVMKSPHCRNLLGHFSKNNSSESIAGSKGWAAESIAEERASVKSDNISGKMSTRSDQKK